MPSDSDDRYRYLIRKRDGSYWAGDGRWVRRKDRAKHITGADNAWHYAENNLYDYIEEIDVVIP